jgi:hypothetical protein
MEVVKMFNQTFQIQRKSLLNRIVIALLVVTALLFSAAYTAKKVHAAAITMVSYGVKVVPGNTEGDDWDTTWLANDKIYIQNDDGGGFNNPGHTNNHDRISELFGTPENPATLGGSNRNPGSVGNFLGGAIPGYSGQYSSGVYEVGGVLYHFINASQQLGNDFFFSPVNIIKSTDGGANWVNHLGQTNTLPSTVLADSMFPSNKWALANFVKYGQGGVAPNVDNAQTYVYMATEDGSGVSGAPDSGSIGDDYYLARIKRVDLPSLDRTKIEFYKGGGLDGMLNTSWGTISQQATMLHSPSACGSTSIMYNPVLQRYILTTMSGNSWSTPRREAWFHVYEAPHPWGPWTSVLNEINEKKFIDQMTFPFLMQKYMSADGKKMWSTLSGRAPYGLQFAPLYITTAPVSTYEAESAALTGVTVSTVTPGYSGTGYAAGINAVGDKVVFTINATSAGQYIINFRYHTTADSNIVMTINGVTIGTTLGMGKTEGDYPGRYWSDFAILNNLNSGTNTVEIKYSSGSVDIDKLNFALNMGTGGLTKIDDTAAGITYSGTWNTVPLAGYYGGTAHYTSTVGSFMQYTFSGTSVKVYGATNNNHGKADVYMDGVFSQTIDTYSASTVFGIAIYNKTGLASGSHTVKIVERSDKNPSSTGFYTDVDAIEY